MKTIQDAIRQEIDLLHFTQALDLLDSIGDSDKTARDWFDAGVCHASIYATRKAEQDYFKVLSLGSGELSMRARMRLVQLYTQSGQLDKAESVYETLTENPESDPGPCRLFYGALLYYEKGDLEKALHLASQLAHKDSTNSQTLERLRCESWILCGDLYSATGEFKEALSCYGKALGMLSCWPENWRPLRKALILNNLADVYEQFEYWKEAESVYKQAWKCIRQLDDPDIYDLNGYKLEILLSMANFYALQDELEQAKAILKEAMPIARAMEMPMILYWKSRISYIGGLCELYSENPKYDPFEKLFDAWRLQEQFLSVSTASSREYLGRTAYYAAYCYNPDKAEGISQKYLYEKALSLFQQCYFKDPKFFLFCIASVENELGTLEIDKDPAKASDLYASSIRDYREYLHRWPEDSLAQTSLLAVLLNLFSCISQPDLEKHGSRLLDIFEETLQRVLHDPETRIQGEEALGRLLDSDRLYALFPKRLESIHGLLPRAVYM